MKLTDEQIKDIRENYIQKKIEMPIITWLKDNNLENVKPREIISQVNSKIPIVDRTRNIMSSIYNNVDTIDTIDKIVDIIDYNRDSLITKKIELELEQIEEKDKIKFIYNELYKLSSTSNFNTNYIKTKKEITERVKTCYTCEEQENNECNQCGCNLLKKIPKDGFVCPLKKFNN